MSKSGFKINKKVVASIEARMGSSRLPGKMNMELYPGLPALGAAIERLKASRMLAGITVATTTDSRDNILDEIAHRYNVSCYRGSPDDVLGRVVDTGRIAGADALVLVTGDCSLISARVIDEGVDFFLTHKYDLVSNCLEDAYPIGIDMQVVSLTALEKAHTLALKPPHSTDTNNFEHVNFFISKHPELFSIYRYPPPVKYHRPDIRLALDTKSDLIAIREIYSKLYPRNRFFDIDDILELLEKEPGIMKMTRNIIENNIGI